MLQEELDAMDDPNYLTPTPEQLQYGYEDRNDEGYLIPCEPLTEQEKSVENYVLKLAQLCKCTRCGNTIHVTVISPNTKLCAVCLNGYLSTEPTDKQLEECQGTIYGMMSKEEIEMCR